MNAIPTEYDELQQTLADWTLKGQELKRALRQGRIQELTAQGERVLVRPIMVQHPGKGGQCDPWFGLNYWDWRKLRQEGFDGFMATTTDSAHPKIMILVEKAVQFLEERCRRQAARRTTKKKGTP
jgi:hypothetical protein